MTHDDGQVKIHEYYPSEETSSDSEEDCWTFNPVTMEAESVEELRWMLEAMLRDLSCFSTVDYHSSEGDNE